MGWHIRGEMGGVWAHPIKLLDGYWFSVDDTWLPAASRFTSGAGYVQMNFPTTGGLDVTRTEFSPDGSPVTLTGLTLRNPGNTSRSFRLTMDARSEVMAAYPWGWTTPNAKEFNGKDQGSYDPSTGTLTFQESGKPWHAAVRASVTSNQGVVNSASWGPVTVSVLPDVPDSWPGLSVQNLKVGGGTMTSSASRSGKEYTTKVSAPAGWKLTIGHTLPAGATVKTVTLDGKSTKYAVVNTTRGREVRVETTTDQSHTLVVTTG